MRKTTAYLILLFITFAISAKGINSRYLFKKLNNDNGLSFNSVHGIVQEESGIMWFATYQGLNKYDSYNIKRYYKEDNVGIPSNIITSLLINKDNRLFVGTQEGLIVYDRRFDKFNSVLYSNKKLSHVRTLFERSNGTVLIGTFNGIYAYNPTEETMVHFVSLRNEVITSIIEYESDVILVTTFSGIYFLNPDGVLLDYYNKTNTPDIPSSFFQCSYIDRTGTCWVGTNNNGLFIFNKEEKTFKKVSISGKEKPETKVVRVIEEDLDGNIWIGGEQGIFIFDVKSRKTINIQHSLEPSEYHLNDKAIYCLFRSKENIMWVGTYFGGVNYTNLGDSKGFYNIHPGDGKNKLRGKAVSKLFKDTRGTLWIATENGGACSFNTKTKQIIDYFQHGSSNSISSNNIHAICEDNSRNIWFGCFMTGIDVYSPTSGVFKNISLRPNVKYSINENSVFCNFKDSKGQVWIGSLNGIYRYDWENEKVVPFKEEEFGTIFIYNIIEDRNGKIWFCLHADGIASYNPVTDEIRRYNIGNGLSTNRIIAAMEDSAGKILFGSIDGGVNIYTPKTDSFEHLGMEDGLPNNTIYGILEDDSGNIWLSTNQGISMYNTKTRIFRNYNRNDGLAQMQFNYGSCFKDSDGMLYFGHVNGLTYFKPDEIRDNTIKPQLFFTDFKLANESIPVKNKGILTQPINQTQNITLSYSQRSFTIDFVAINYISVGNNKFYFYLDGFEEDWIEAGNKTSASYSNLLPGKYTFHLKAVNNDGVESANTKTLQIRIRPPFYLTVWAYIIYFAVLAFIFFLYRKITIDKEKEKTALKLERMEKEKIKEANLQRLNFYTYISHEFKTPLSIIISSIDQFFSDSKISNDSKNSLQRLKRSSKRLSFLFTQLMDFRKIQSKHAKLVLQKGDIIDFLRETCMVFSPLFDQQRVNFEFKTNREIYEHWFDPDKIEKIIANLLSNALKHSPIHGLIVCEIEINDDMVGEEQKRINICISDNGKGISKEEQKNLFIPFYIMYQSNEQKSGSGIGLTLVKSLVEYLHGTIVVISSPNEGTKFKIQLPLDYKGISNIKLENTNETISRNIDLDSLAGFSKQSLNEYLPTKEDKEFKLLIVEDTLDLAEVLIAHYSKSFSVKFAPNGIDALNIVKDEEPDIIISDVMMPKMDGIEFCKRIKQDEATSHIAIIILTSKTTHEDKIAGLQAGAEAYVYKPFDLNELDLHVRNFIEVRKKLKESVVTGRSLNLEKLKFQDKDKEFIEKVSIIISENIENESFNNEELAKLLGMSKSLVYLKLKKLLNMSGSDYIQSLRFKKAIELMADSNLNIADISYEVGFSDPNYFSKAFKKAHKKTPSEFRKELLNRISK